MTPTQNGAVAINDYPAKTTLNHADDFSAVSTGATSPVAHPARTMARTGHFCTDTVRVEQLVKHHGAVATMPAGADNTQQLADNRPVSAVSFCPEFADTAQCRIHGYGGMAGTVTPGARLTACYQHPAHRLPLIRHSVHPSLS